MKASTPVRPSQPVMPASKALNTTLQGQIQKIKEIHEQCFANRWVGCCHVEKLITIRYTVTCVWHAPISPATTCCFNREQNIVMATAIAAAQSQQCQQHFNCAWAYKFLVLAWGIRYTCPASHEHLQTCCSCLMPSCLQAVLAHSLFPQVSCTK